jgi:hypothetical protein
MTKVTLLHKKTLEHDKYGDVLPVIASDRHAALTNNTAGGS